MYTFKSFFFFNPLGDKLPKENKQLYVYSPVIYIFLKYNLYS